MRNDFYFQLDVTKEQLDCANKLVEYSILHYKGGVDYGFKPAKMTTGSSI